MYPVSDEHGQISVSYQYYNKQARRTSLTIICSVLLQTIKEMKNHIHYSSNFWVSQAYKFKFFLSWIQCYCMTTDRFYWLFFEGRECIRFTGLEHSGACFSSSCASFTWCSYCFTQLVVTSVATGVFSQHLVWNRSMNTIPHYGMKVTFRKTKT